ncbi:bacitracin ABC transporter ATP-binding protein [Bacillus pseudomycoides]|uniref:Bacitracin ABC transporter ATP-binding protein n=1 Tax=Bacillus pseudomycoides TaxID=64104 RepID=A0AA91ZUQ9_9BACI|nr:MULTISPECIES: ATP-binding cassette domain-containing protein [Bacillus]PEB54354.1 bacitracin ABC transporter ATP-binding protein [Bacillus sp. AFS098217]PED83965.1 bacitracin ABC transporter ATP-binding protein [Bacillus pseudomycoides]PEU16633.1 bacitracin ABC transporter ATP-binding protein [Bacillus sp. AFS019443]
MSYVLRTYGLTKKYKDVIAVDNVSMNIKKGEIYGFLGQNGAGKTTAMRMIVGLIKPSKGEIELFGERIKANGHSRPFERIGAMIETPGFYPNLTGEENLEIHRRLMGFPDKSSVDTALAQVDLLEAKKRKVKTYSLGMKQRLGLARALLHEPELLLLDEPTNGLDPSGIKEVRKMILHLAKERGITVLISSHILSEIEQLAEKIGIIHKGKLLKELDSKTIRDMNKHYIEFQVINDKMAIHLLEKELNIRNYQVVEPGIIRIYENSHDSITINKMFIQNNIDVKKLNISKDTLEDFFIRLTEGE